MADSIISVVAEKIKALIEEQTRCHVNLVGGAEKEVRILAKELEGVRYMVDDAERKGYKKERIKFWLPRLEQTSHELEDVLDEWNHALIEVKIEQHQFDDDAVVAPMKKVRSFIPSSSCLCSTKAANLPRDIAKKIIDVNAKLEEVLQEQNRYAFVISQSLISDPPHTSWRFPTTYFSDLEVAHGRDFDRDILVAKLLCRQEELGIQVVSIVGDGRLGKTTLARLVYNDSRVEKYFDLRFWICVSNGFYLPEIAKGILWSVGEGGAPNTTSLYDQLKDVIKYISGKRYLLVIDDVRDRDSRTWIHLKGYLKYGEAGSSILVTTRCWDTPICHAVDAGIHHLGKFTEEECRLLLHVEAFSERFKDIGELIADKCEGSPLVAHYLGSLLRSEYSLEDCSNVSFMEMQQLKAVEKNLFPHFSSSNNEFYPTLKRCFSYCAIFPKDSEIVVEDLIGNWMALGYLGSNTSDMELKGRRCFEFLASDSLFQD